MAVIISDGISNKCTRAIKAFPSFKDNPKLVIEKWGRMLKGDKTKQLENNRVLIIFQNMSQAERNAVAAYIRANYKLGEDEYPIALPDGKICLHDAKDTVERDLEKHSPKHLLVLLYSITREWKNKSETHRTISVDSKIPYPDKLSKRRDEISRKTLKLTDSPENFLQQKGNEVIIGKKDYNITFSIKLKKNVNIDMLDKDKLIKLYILVAELNKSIPPSRENHHKITFCIHKDINIDKLDKSRLIKLYNLVAGLNAFMPSRPVKKVYVYIGKNGGSYSPQLHEMSLPLLRTSLFDTAAHETGHAIFTVKLGGEARYNNDMAVKDELWQRIYYFSTGFDYHELVDDSNYSNETDGAGHPDDNASELFASSVSAYRLHPDKFIKNILDPDTPEGMKKLGILIWCYLRDRVFIKEGDTKGMVFSETDPFAHISLESVELKDEEVFASRVDGLIDNDGVRWAAARASVDPKDPRFYDLFINSLIEATGNSDLGIRSGAIRAIGELGTKDPRFIKPLIMALGDSETDWEAIVAIGKLNDLAFINHLLKAFNNGNPDIRKGAAKAIGRFEDPRVIELVGKALDSSHPNVRITAAMAIGEFLTKLNNPRILALLRKALDNGDPKVREAAALAIGKSKDNIEEPKVVALLQKALDSSHPNVRKAAAQAISKLEYQTCIKFLIAALENDDFEVRGIAIETIHFEKIEDKKLIEPLIKVLKENRINEQSRIAAAEFLGKVGDETILPALNKILIISRNDPGYEAITNAYLAIQKRESAKKAHNNPVKELRSIRKSKMARSI